MKKLIAVLTFVIAAVTLNAQNDYEAWLKKEDNKLKSFMEEDDKKFVEFLKKEWKQYELLQTKTPFEKPKPKTPIIFKPEENKEKPIELKPQQKAPEQKTEIAPPPIPPKPIIKEKPIPITGTQFVSKSFLFHQEPLSINLEESYKLPKFNAISNENIAEYWKEISSSQYKPLQTSLFEEKIRLKLNDWGYAKLLFETAKKEFNATRDEAYLFSWFMLVKSGYSAKVGYTENKIFLIAPTKSKLFGIPYFSFTGSNDRYYIVPVESAEINDRNITTYKDDFTNSSQIFDYTVSVLPAFSKNIVTTEMKFNRFGLEYKYRVQYNKSLIDYFKYYPYTNMDTYFKSKLSDEAHSTLVNGIKDDVKEMSEVDKVAFILRFVQFATDYKTDPEQFGREKPLFPEESLHYKYTDCEDRSILFAYLVKRIVGLKVVGLDYPDHIATAVKFTGSVPGDYFTHNGEKYIICDPTYIGADVGKSMSGYQQEPFDVIDF